MNTYGLKSVDELKANRMRVLTDNLQKMIDTQVAHGRSDIMIDDSDLAKPVFDELHHGEELFSILIKLGYSVKFKSVKTGLSETDNFEYYDISWDNK